MYVVFIEYNKKWRYVFNTITGTYDIYVWESLEKAVKFGPLLPTIY